MIKTGSTPTFNAIHRTHNAERITATELTEDTEKINVNTTDLIILSLPKNLFKTENTIFFYFSDRIDRIYKIKLSCSSCYPVK